MEKGYWRDEETAQLRYALRDATEALLAEMGGDGHWTGRLSASALSTATAVTALAAMSHEEYAGIIADGLCWLAEKQNADGGWGDTTISKSNVSTTALCWAAFNIGGGERRFAETVERAEGWLNPPGSEPLVERIKARYGKDRTFSVPILMMLALCGRIDWREVPALPFELAAMSHRFWGMLRLPVVSYALPALIAIGQIIHFNRPTRNPITRFLRALTKKKTLRVLEKIQPSNGGFLEATPLTSFVTMSLAGMGLASHPVAQKGAAFLVASVREDGSWAIDTDLATWTTTLAVKALANQQGALSPEQRLTIREWLLGQQWMREHPYTHAAPGGWAWTDLPGGVPDADDTPGALLALLRLGAVDERTEIAGVAGVRWLLGVQNRDGGIPTFCRGWGALPFDRSSPDLTAHTLRAWNAWRTIIPAADRPRLEHAMTRALRFLKKRQHDDGFWLPLWFGNEHVSGDDNPLYGTAKVVIALREVAEAGHRHAVELSRRGAAWIAAEQNEDGGWGGVRGVPSSTEETALAVEALAGTEHVEVCDRGVAWLLERVKSGAWKKPAPIGFYFAKLWYYEKLYPMIWTVGALGWAARHRE
jgi:squalene-hopene/tetraprenyl-beta-curcumene cyclase